MEEEKKEEVVEPVSTPEVVVETPAPVVEPVITNEVKQENNNKKGKGGIIALVILLILALGVGGFFAYKYFTKEDTKSKEEEKNETTINYELKQGTDTMELYVNGKKVDGIEANGVTKNHIYQVKDALLVVECFDNCEMKMVDKDGKVFKGITGKLTDGGTNFTELKNDDIYFSSYADFYYQDESLLCKFKDDDIVYVEEKITYLGNKSFSEQQEVMTMTKKEYLKGKTLDCSSETQKEETKINYNIKDSRLYVNNKKIDPDGSGIFSVTKDNLYDLGDLLLVGDCRSGCEWYFIDANATIVGSLGDDSTFANNKKSLVSHKFPVIVIDKVEGKDIYFTDWSYSTQDASSICEFDENEAVYANEKVTYNGNKTFSSTTTITTKTRAEISKEDGRFAIDCSKYSN